MKRMKKLCTAFAVTALLAVGGAFVPTYTAKAENKVDVTASVSASGWVGALEGLKVTYLDLGENVEPAIGYAIIDGAYTYVQDYIAINGRTVKEINTDTTLGASEWAYANFPSTSGNPIYKVPVIIYVNNGLIEIKIHDNYLATLGDFVEITAKAGLYFENNGTRYEVTEDKTFTVFGYKLKEVDITAGVSINDWNTTGGAGELTYTIARFPEGVLPKISYGIIDHADWKYLQEYITFNGKTVKEINEETDTSGYEFSTFPSNADVKYRLPIIVYQENNRIELKVHNTYLESVQGNLEIAIKAGFSVVNGDTTYVVSSDITYVIEGMEEVDITEEISIGGWDVTGKANELTYTRITFPSDVLPDISYDALDKAAWTYIQDYIFINGRSVKEINEETDVSGYTFATFPSTADVKYQLPIILYQNGNSLEVKIHNDYLGTLTGSRIEITLKEGFSVTKDNVKYLVNSDISYVITKVDITENISIDGWWSTGDKEELTYTLVQFPSGVLPTSLDYSAMDKTAWKYLQKYICLNGKTVEEINAETDVSGYEFSTFPSTVNDKYKVPVILYENGNSLEVKIHNAYLKTTGDSVVLTVKAGFSIVNGDVKYIVSEDVERTVLTITETDITEGVSVGGWAAAGDNMELTYTRIQFPEGVLPETLDYHVIDDMTWAYLQEYILLNGKSIAQINAETNTENYVFSTFPSTNDMPVYKVPVIVFENNNALELKFHNTYLQTVDGDLEITIKAGLSVLIGETRYVVSKDICYRLSGEIWSDIHRVYTITYYVNGKVYGEPEQYPYGTPFVLRANVVTDAGYAFSGWEYTPTANVIQDMEIRGYVRPIAYMITYYVNGGMNNPSNPVTYYVTDGEILLKDAVKDGAVFKGWYTSEDYTQKVEKLSPEQLGDLELYALFEETKASKKGCQSVAGTGVGSLVLAGVAILLKKRKNKK